jgi:hypothetical protein
MRMRARQAGISASRLAAEAAGLPPPWVAKRTAPDRGPWPGPLDYEPFNRLKFSQYLSYVDQIRAGVKYLVEQRGKKSGLCNVPGH